MQSHLLRTRVKTAKGRKASSTAWLQRQLNDPYVKRAHDEGYRGRAAFKILELNEMFHFFKKGARIVDLGCAPGGWSQVAVQKTGSTDEKPCVFGIDILPIEPLFGAKFIQMDFNDNQAPDALKEIMQGNADVVMSDIAPNTTGIQKVDHLRIMNLVELGYDFAKQVLNQNGWFIAKIFAGATDGQFIQEIKSQFEWVKHIKPPASRKDSVEYYLVAKGFKCTPNK